MTAIHASQETDKNAKTILVIEDDDGIGEVIVQIIRQETPYQVIRTVDGHQAWTLLHHLIPDLLILDYNLPIMNGIELYDRIHARKEFAYIPAFIMSAYRELCENEAKVRNLPCLHKPFEIDDFLHMVGTLIR